MNDEKCRVVYTIYEYDPLLDSTNMTMDDWINVCVDIKVNKYSMLSRPAFPTLFKFINYNYTTLYHFYFVGQL